MNDQPSNNTRASWANTAVQAMGLETMDRPQDEEISTLISDLLCNLQHLCDAEGLGFQHILDGATRTYFEETSEQPPADCDYASGEAVQS